jgi:benzoate/toluate 1,2-dioxygenase beta subunit
MSDKPEFQVEDADLLAYFQQFLIHEAWLLDDQKFEEWSELFIEDGEYWVPVSPDQPDPVNHLSLMYETDLLRTVRVKRFSHPTAYSLQPLPRTAHLISNIMIDNKDNENHEYSIRSTFVMTHYRREVQDIYSGTYHHRLRIEDGQCKIVMKKVNLVNFDAALSNIMVYF